MVWRTFRLGMEMFARRLLLEHFKYSLLLVIELGSILISISRINEVVLGKQCLHNTLFINLSNKIAPIRKNITHSF